jgi:PBP1b-binding outer membrane lipoprotein LpoB
MIMKKMSFVFTLLAAAAMLLSACGPAATTAAPAPATQAPAAPVLLPTLPAPTEAPTATAAPKLKVGEVTDLGGVND